jgi:hypothetical protein
MSFTIGEDLVLPAAICRKIVEILDESKYANDIKKFLCQTTLSRIEHPILTRTNYCKLLQELKKAQNFQFS